MDARWLSNGMHVCEVSMSSEKLEVEKTESMLQNSPIAFCDSCASLVLINFSPASRTRQTHAKHEPGLNCFLALGDKSNGNSMQELLNRSRCPPSLGPASTTTDRKAQGLLEIEPGISAVLSANKETYRRGPTEETF